MTGPFTAAERHALENALRQNRPLRCPHCAVELSRQTVERPHAVSYVRHRLWVLCPHCRRTAALDAPHPEID